MANWSVDLTEQLLNGIISHLFQIVEVADVQDGPVPSKIINTQVMKSSRSEESLELSAQGYDSLGLYSFMMIHSGILVSVLGAPCLDVPLGSESYNSHRMECRSNGSSSNSNSGTISSSSSSQQLNAETALIGDEWSAEDDEITSQFNGADNSNSTRER